MYILHNHIVISIFIFQLYIDLNTLMKGMGVNHRLYLRLLLSLSLMSEKILQGKFSLYHCKLNSKLLSVDYEAIININIRNFF